MDAKEAWIQDTMRRNPGLTREGAEREYLLALKDEEGSQTPRDLYSRAAAAVTEPLAGGIGRFFQGMTEGPGGFTRPAEGSTAMASEMIAKAIIPQTPEALALTLAAPGLQRLAPMTGRGAALNPAVRTGAAVGLGGTTAELTGGEFAEGAQMGLIGGVAGEVARIPGSTRSLWREHMGTQANRMRWAAQDADDLVRTTPQQPVAPLFADVPQLLPALRAAKNPGDFLARIEQIHPGHKKPLGDVLLSVHYGKTEQAVVAVLGGPTAMIPLPSFARAKGLPTMGVTPQVTIKDALEELKSLTAQALKPKNIGPDGHIIREIRDQMRGEILQAIERRSPALAQRWIDEFGLYRRGKTFLEGLHGSRALRGETRSTKGEVFDADAFLDYLRDAQEIGQLPNVQAALLRGSARNAISRHVTLPRGRVYKAGESATFALPTLRVEARGGFPPLKVGALPSIAEIGATNVPGAFTVE